MLNKGKLVFDATQVADSDNVGAYLRSSDGTLITHTNVGGKDALDVNVANTIDISATNLDIRDLSHTQDSVRIGDGTDLALVSAAGELQVRDNDANTSLDNIETSVGLLDDVVFTDNAAFTDGASKGAVVFGVDNSGNVQPFRFNASNELLVSADLVNSAEYAEDSAHASGDIGLYTLSVREDTLSSSTSASGDYQSFKTDALGRLYINDASQTAAYGAVSVGNTATDIVATDLVNRRKILIQNIDNKAVYIGTNASVTTSNGIRLDAGSALELDIAAGVNVHGITAAGTVAVRYLEIA